MRRLLADLALALALSSACATAANAGDTAEATPDPLHSEACTVARAELERALGAPPARRSIALEAARRRTADACLGKASGTPQRSGAPDPALTVLPPRVETARPPAPPAAVVPAAPPLAIPRPTSITACDPSGCWDSEGRRLNQSGPFLVGPTGPCNTQGGLVTCP